MKKILLFIFLNLACVNAQAFDIPENKNEYVLDKADIFSDLEEENLNSQIQDIEKNTTVEVAVFTFLDLEDQDISQLAVNVGRQWGVGKKENNNGIVLLIAKNNRKWFMATGYGLEGTVPDILAKRIGEKNFPVNFRKGAYFSGVSLAIKDLNGLLLNNPEVIAQYKNKNREEYIGFIIFLMFLFSMVGRIWVHSDDNTSSKGSKALFLSAIFGILSYVIVLIIPVTLIFSIFLLLSLLGENNGDSSGGFSGGSFGGGGGSFGGGSFGGGGGGGSW